MSVDPASVDPASVHPTSVVEDGASIGEGCTVGPFCHVGANVTLGEGCELVSHVSVRGRTTIGAGSRLFPHCSVGGEPQFIGYDGTLTDLVIGERCVVREGASISTGIPQFGGVTRIGDDCMILANAHVAHDCQLGNNVVLVNACELGGHVHIDDRAFISSNVLIHQHTRIGRNAFVGGGTPLKQDVIPFGMADGNPARLQGLNVIGMRRSGLSGEAIRRTRAAYRIMFGGDVTLQEGVQQVEAEFSDVPTVMSLVEFIRARGDRPILAPERTARRDP